MMAGTVAVLFLTPLLTGLAAPAALPICGNSRIKPGTTSYTGPPDIAKSADETYTAVVWAEGVNGIGPVNLAYSDIPTTTRIWNITPVASGDNREPAIAFAPSGNTTVHIAYRQEESGTNLTGIRYIRCTLGGVCGSERTIATGTTSDNYTSPKIVVNAAGDPVIVYQKNTAGTSRIYYAYIESGGSGTIWAGFLLVTGSNDNETNPTVAYSKVGSAERVHVAYVADGPVPDGTTDQIKYTQLIVDDSLSGGALTSGYNATFPKDNGDEPQFPAIDAINGTVVLVWDVKQASKFHLAYNMSHDNGDNWELRESGDTYNYYYLPSGSSSALGAPPSSDDRPSQSIPPGSQFNGRLQPDVTLHMSGSITITHVAWHEETSSRRDVMYSFFDGSQWRGTPILSGVTAISYTNVTTVYGESAADPATEKRGNLDNVRPRLVFNRLAGQNRHRLQMVYMSQKKEGDQTMWYLRYDGWELGSNFINPIRSERDSDCDNRSDEQELTWPPGFDTSHTICKDDPTVGDLIIDSTGEGDPDHFNCNSTVDVVPDFLDTNADGDFQNDDVDSGWREYSTTGGVFLPIILKNS